MKDVGLFIGRFQPFHYGHLATVRLALQNVKLLYIIVGSSQKSHESRNPFTAGERIMMIRNALMEEEIDSSRYLILPIPDAIGHAVWTAFIDQVVPKYDVVYSNDSLTLQLFREKRVEVVEPVLFKRPTYSATQVRKRIMNKGDWESLVPPAVARIIAEILKKGRFKGLET